MQTESPSQVLLLAMVIASLFFIKFVAYAWLVTPLWDIPDESGHYSYVEDIAEGKWPLLGVARMGDDVMRSWKSPSAKPALNWIAQHPPLFYVLDAPSILVARAAGLNFEQQVRSARILSSVFGALTILGLALFLARVTENDKLGLAGAIFFGATPMFTHLSTGVTHDTLVACLAAWAAYWCARWLESGRFHHVLYAGALVAACTVTKLTALAMAIPFFFMLAWRLWCSRTQSGLRHWLLRALVLWLVMFIPMCLWITRNLLTLHQMFPDAGLIYGNKHVDIGFFEYMFEFPLWQHTLINFIALIGWNGSDHGALRWVHANGWMARYFLAFIGITGSAVVLDTFRHDGRLLHLHRPVIGVGLIVAAYCFSQWPLTDLATWTCVVLFVAMACTLGAHTKGIVRTEDTSWLLATCAVCTLFFAFVYYEYLWASFSGVLRAAHGRYLYPVVPFLLLVLVWPFRKPRAARVLLCAAVLAMVFADGFFLHQIFHLYGEL